MTKFHMLIGLPAAGKSTWRDLSADVYDSVVASSDDYIENMAVSEGKTYNDVFKQHIKGAEVYVNSLVTHAVTENKNLIWDQTNLSVKTRAKKIARIPFDWHKTAVMVRCRDFEVWKKRLMSRPGKTIPVNIIQSMMGQFEMPTLAEGFDEILEVWT